MMRVLSNLEQLLERPAGTGSSGQTVDSFLARNAGQVLRSRHYRVYLPSGYDGGRALPLVMVLHGCRQDHVDIQAITGFDSIADRENFIAVYPFVTSHSAMRTRNCWGWWLHQQRVRDRGEVRDLLHIVADVVRDYAVDQSRMHICGLSAGAAMSVVALATYSDIWKSGASVAGVSYGESARAVQYSSAIPVKYKPLSLLERMLRKALVSDAPGLLVIQSTTDQQVHLQASVHLVETWRRACQLPDRPYMFSSGTTRNYPWRYGIYQDEMARARLGYMTVEDVDHGWIGGNPGRFSTPDAPNVSELIWAFFEESEAGRRS